MTRYDILRLPPEVVDLVRAALHDENAMDVWIDLLLAHGELRPMIIDPAYREAAERVYGADTFTNQERFAHRKLARQLAHRVLRELAR